MSEIAEYIEASVRSYVDDEIGIDTFRLAFVGAYVHVRNHANSDPVANRLASRLMAPFAEFSAGHRSEQSLRMELESAIRSFVPSRRSWIVDIRKASVLPGSTNLSFQVSVQVS